MAYLFDPVRLHEIAKDAVGLEFDDMVEALVSGLAAAYPGHIETQRREWIFSMVGGATGVMSLLHGSLSEYLLLFGSSVGTHGFSGRYRLDIYDFIIAGEITNQYLDRPGVRDTAVPGDVTRLPKGSVTAYRASPGSWVLEYARGPIVTAMPMGLADALFRGLDGTTLYRSIASYTRLATRELLKGKF